MSDLILFEHEDGRYGVAPEGLADFTNGEPKWHRVGPVEVVRLAQAEAKPAVRLHAQVQPAEQVGERELDLYDEIECDLPYLFGRASAEGHESGQRLAKQVREKMQRARLATPAQHQPVSAEAIKQLRIAGYKFEAPGISKIDVWPHGGAWEPLIKLSDALAALTPPAHPAEPGKGGA